LAAVVPEGASTDWSFDSAPDRESVSWLRALRGEPADRNRAVRDLHTLLLRASRFEVHRRRASIPEASTTELDDLATQCADDALLAVMRKLDDYRGASRFTTWVYKFAIFEASVTMRRRSWQGREIPREPAEWRLAMSASAGPEQIQSASELADLLRRSIDQNLSSRQREVLVAIAVNGVPIDVLATRLETSRGAIYKTLHDARQRLRTAVVAAGFADSLPSAR
jgi:RNA polymerase sigma-70 factor (ECF subfamily)